MLSQVQSYKILFYVFIIANKKYSTIRNSNQRHYNKQMANIWSKQSTKLCLTKTTVFKLKNAT